MVFDLATSLTGYVIIAFTFWGWGALLSRQPSKTSHHGIEGIFSNIWLGFCYTLAFMQIWQVFKPISWRISVAAIGIGVGGCLFSWLKNRPEDDSLPAYKRKEVIIGVMTLIIVASLIAIRAMLEPTKHDSGLYHFNSIRWLNEYPIIPGLGNLHGRLAFNQSFFSYVAFLNFFPFWRKGYHLANSFLLFLVTAESLFNVFRAIISPSTMKRSTVFSILCLPILALLGISESLSSPTPDLASYVLLIVLTYHFLRFMEVSSHSQKWKNEISLMIIVAVTAATIKLSNAMFCALLVGCVLTISLKRSNTLTVRNLSCFLWPAVFSFSLFAVWAWRGIILSGYPLYPTTIAGLDLGWAVPLAQAQNEARWIYGWARQPGVHPDQVLESWQWLKPWAERIISNNKPLFQMVCPSLVVGAGLLIHFAMSLRLFVKKQYVLKPQLFWVAFVPPLGGILFWFFMAPKPRFAGSMFWIIALIVILPFFEHIQKRKVIYQLVLISILLPYAIFLSSYLFLEFPFSGYVSVRTVPLQKEVTDSGLEVYTPKYGSLCWDSPLPATPHFDARLRLRGTGLESGFTTRN